MGKNNSIIQLNIPLLQAMSYPAYSPEPATSPYNPSGLYGLKGMRKSVPDYPHPSLSILPTIPLHYTSKVVQEKKMAKLSPLMVDMKQDKKPKMFPRFMAVPWRSVSPINLLFL